MYVRGFDGLRAVAMLLVFLTHKTAWGAETQVGFSGVWLFFVLSGYLITGQLREARARMERGTTTLRRELRVFWLKRAMRIFPAYYLLVLVLVPFYWWTGRDVAGLPAYITYLSNIYFQNHPAAFLTTWAHFWTLAVEEQFYVLFAPLLLLVPSRYASAACALVVGGSLAQRFGLAGAGVAPFVVYVDSLVNFGLLALGALLFIHRAALVATARRWGIHRGAVGWATGAAVIALPPLASAVTGSDLVRLQWFYVATAALVLALLVNVLANQASILVRRLEWRPLVVCGRISYGLYLYNDYIKNDIPERLLRSLASHFWPAEPAPPWVAALLDEGTLGWMMMRGCGLLLCLVLLLAVATLSWRIVERPALLLRDRMTRVVGAQTREAPVAAVITSDHPAAAA